MAAKLDPPGTAPTTPASCRGPVHATGNVFRSTRWPTVGDDELWFVNTRFSCLCTLDRDHSFVPRWQPPFISALAPEDRCHLNGLAMERGEPRFVSALGTSDEKVGWREDKARGGMLMDVPSGEIAARGLSMPHSPRIRGDGLWACESGAGTVGRVDLARGRYEPVASFPGFTRGLDFAGRFAFVGLSQVRESAVFSGIPLTERQEERSSGVWVLDLVTGRVAAFLKFEDAVQEVFAVQVIPDRIRPDLINDDEPRLADSFVLPTRCLEADAGPA